MTRYCRIVWVSERTEVQGHGKCFPDSWLSWLIEQAQVKNIEYPELRHEVVEVDNPPQDEIVGDKR